MPDEFQDITVADATAPVESAPLLDVAPDEPVSAAPEAMPAEVEATQINLDPADDVLKNNSQQVYNELMGRDSGAAPITAQAMAAKEDEKEAKKSDAIQNSEEGIKRAEAQREFMNKEHEFGGMKMSGQDLSKLINFYNNNPQMMDKLKEKLGKSGMSKEKVDQTAKDFDEYMKILKKESEGVELSEEEKRRKSELSKDKNVIEAAQQFTEIAQRAGVDLEFGKNTNVSIARTAKSEDVRVQASTDARNLNYINSTTQISKNDNAFGDLTSSSVAKAHFASAPDLKDDFSTSANKKLVASNDVKQDFSADVSATIVAAAPQTQKSKPLVLDTSFG